MIWRAEVFTDAFERRGYALLSGKVGYCPVGRESAIIIKTAEDLRLAEHVIQARLSNSHARLEYASEVNALLPRTID